ncbi:conjugal transfer protein TraD [Elizabethkingia anophelis]|nr:conjugal transfer protein TraD [Elizabethkingia anophelis]
METVIVTCLLILIALKLHDKMVSKKIEKSPPDPERVNPNLPDIMGQPKLFKSHRKPKTAIESQQPIQQPNLINFDKEYDANEFIAIQIPQEEPEEVFDNMSDFNFNEEEEEEWKRQDLTSIESSFSHGVTYDELRNVSTWLQEEKLEKGQLQTATAIVQKIQGTELFNLLENSVEGASRKIAELLDKTLSSETETGSSIVRKNDLEDFDIGEFV